MRRIKTLNRALIVLALAFTGGASLLGCGGKAGWPRGMLIEPSIVMFENVQPTSGVNFPLGFRPGQTLGIKETAGHAAALLDADGDGLLDILLAGPDRVALFRNLGGWQFERLSETGFRQVGFWQGVAVGDADDDGRPDVFLSGYGCSAFYRNRGGGRFQDATAAAGLGAVPSEHWQTSASFADVDRDGRLDLYVTCYVDLAGKTGVCAYPGGVNTACAPTEFSPQRGTLYRNLGGGHFEDATETFGLDAAHGNGLGAAFGDSDDDGFPDLYLANDLRPCNLFLNERGHSFVERGVLSGTAYGVDGATQAGMGVDFADYDGDGREDLVVTNYLREPTSLYHNEGQGLFTNASSSSRLGAATLATVGWGVKWVDLDNDGLLDLVIANGHPLYEINKMDPTTAFRQRFQVFRNEGRGSFQALTSVGKNLPHALAGRALCTGDMDNDGNIDVLISDIEGQPLLLRNTTSRQNHWLTVRLVGRGVMEGALIVARAGTRTWTRRSTTSGSYLSASDPRLHFGLGKVDKLDYVQVRWPGGRTISVRVDKVDCEIVVRPEDN